VRNYHLITYDIVDYYFHFGTAAKHFGPAFERCGPVSAIAGTPRRQRTARGVPNAWSAPINAAAAPAMYLFGG
jgi:hypothetical protein